jgi:hypothetical protein
LHRCADARTNSVSDRLADNCTESESDNGFTDTGTVGIAITITDGVPVSCAYCALHHAHRPF